MTTANETRRRVMTLAWSLFRDGGRTFADALRGAWKLTKGLARAARDMMAKARRGGGRVRLSASMIQSPIDRAVRLQACAGVKSWRAAHLTTRIGR